MAIPAVNLRVTDVDATAGESRAHQLLNREDICPPGFHCLWRERDRRIGLAIRLVRYSGLPTDSAVT